MTNEQEMEFFEAFGNLRREVMQLENRVAALESKLQKKEDTEGYAEQGARYRGKHPRSCACNRCLGL